MNKKLLFLLLGAVLCLSACANGSTAYRTAIGDEAEVEAATKSAGNVQSKAVEKEKLAEEQNQLFETYIGELEELLANNKTRIEGCEQYQEYVSTIYLAVKDPDESYHGCLQADYDENGVASIQMMIEFGEKGEASDDRQKWEGQLLGNGSLWLTYQSTYDEKYDLPDYIVNEDVLRYDRADHVYGDGSTDIEQRKKENGQQIMQTLEEDIAGNKKEFWVIEEKVYEIDRENKRFMDVTEEMGGLIASFFAQQPERIACNVVGNEAVLEEVEKWKPEGYSLLYDWHMIAVSDLNKDGANDYVAALYPDDFEVVRRYEDDSPYEMRPEYYAASFWLLLSKENKEYEQIQLTRTIEYRLSDALTLTELGFVKENRIQLEYFVGHSPWYNAVIQFDYNPEEKDFYVYRSYFREDGKLLIGDKPNYGDASVDAYFSVPLPYSETRWESEDDIVLADNAVLSYYSGGFQYGCKNMLEEHRMNSLIWDKEYELAQALQKKYENMELSFDICADGVFYNENIISGRVELDGKATLGNAGYEIDRFIYPIMIDKNGGEYVYVTECIDKEAFLQIFRNYMSEERNRNELDTDELEYLENAIMNHWENADSIEHYINNPEEILCLQIVPEGIRITVRAEEEKWRNDHFVIDRECFLGTELWKYLQPEWL